MLGVAVFGTLYLGLAPHPGREVAIQAFTFVTFAFAITSLLATVAAYLSIRPSITNSRAQASAISYDKQAVAEKV